MAARKPYTLTYRYADGANFKTYGQIVGAAPADPAVVEELYARLRDAQQPDVCESGGFIPTDVHVTRLSPVPDDDSYDDSYDQPWHTLGDLELGTDATSVHDEVTDGGELEELVDAFEAAAAGGWKGQHATAL